MRVGMLVHNPPFQGGIVQYCILLENAMKEYVDYKLVGFRNLYPSFLYKGKLPKINKSGIQFYKKCNAFVDWYNPFSWIKAYNYLKKCDIIHLHWVSPLLTPLQYTILLLNKFFSKKKIVLTCHNIEPHESTILDKLFTKMIFSKADDFIVHAEQNRKRLINDYKIQENNVHMVPHGTFGYFTRWKRKDKEELKKELGFSEKDKVILFFGYIREYKGLRYLLRAMPGIIEKIPDAKLVIAGELWQSWREYEGEIDAKLKGKITLIPNYILDSEVSKYFTIADILVLPYFNSEQTISGPLLVGLAFNKPIIISNVGGIGEIVKNGEEALVVEGGNVEMLKDNAIKLLNDKKLQDKLILGARKKDREFDWKNVAQKTYDVYKEILE